MPDIGYASLPVIPTFKGLQGQLERGSSKGLAAAGASGGTKFGDAAGKSAGKRFGSVFKTAAKAGILAGIGLAAGGAKILGDSIGAASDLNETLSKTEQIFGKNATPALVKFADTADKRLGQSKQQALDAAATFGVFGKAAGLQGRKLVKFSSGLSGLASDLASFSNTSPEEAINAIGSALRGEAEPIRAYGVLLDEATLKAEAMRLGILKPVKDQAKIDLAMKKRIIAQENLNAVVKKKGDDSEEARRADASLAAATISLQKATEGTIPPLTQQQKVLAAQSSIYKQTKDQQGDFARTSGGLANQQRILAARFENTKASLGKGLLPVATDLVTFLNDKGVPALNRFSTWFTDKGIPAIQRFERKATPFVKGVLADTRDVLKDIEPYAKGVAKAFNSLPAGVKKGLGVAALLGFAGSKLPGVPKATGSILGQFTKGGVQKVFVVNNVPGGGDIPGVPGKPGKTPGKTPGIPKGFDKAKPLLSFLSVLPAAGAAGNDTKMLTAPDSKLGKQYAAQIESAKRLAGFTDRTRQVLQKLPGDFDRGMNGAEALRTQVFGIETAARRSRGAVVSLVDELEKARRKAILVDQGVSAARAVKVDGQLGRSSGGMYVANMHVRGTTLGEVKRDADHQRRARAMGSASFRD